MNQRSDDSRSEQKIKERIASWERSIREGDEQEKKEAREEIRKLKEELKDLKRNDASSQIDCLADAVEKLGHNANWLATRMDAVEVRKDGSGAEWAKSVAKGRSKDEILKIASDKESAATESLRRAKSIPQGADAWKGDAQFHAEGAKALRGIAAGMK